ncbi:MAG: glycoside hydrolase family 9 protein [Ignavibacteriales bacterium]|nr:MAG: glycoside hydrolase family 9 protein [Ignavibacteriales bacterium]
MIRIISCRLILFIVIMFAAGCSGSSASALHFRFNHAGYFPEGFKEAIIFSSSEIAGSKVKMISAGSGKTVKEFTLRNNRGTWGKFRYHYAVTFSDIKQKGEYYLQIDKVRSDNFTIGNEKYHTLLPQVLDFFRIQRCGPTNPHLHGVCHLYDSYKIVGDEAFGNVDVTGGWHDAGDYIKFTNTTAVSAYLLALSYVLNPSLHEKDINKNGAPDILEEIKVALDWLLRCNYAEGKLITQVQDMRDHDVGWRLPENDTLKFDRPAYKGEGKNIYGIYSAVMALGAKIWSSRLNEKEFAEKCRAAAEKFYSAASSVPDIDVAFTGMYQDKSHQGKMLLGALELYNLTGRQKYHDDAKRMSSGLQPDYWWSWGDLNALASFRSAQLVKTGTAVLEINLGGFNKAKDNTVYGDAGVYTWGTTTTLFGIAAKAMMYRFLNSANTYDTLAIRQFDYIFGKNPWGKSFVVGLGSSSVRYLHSQIGYFNNNNLPGGIAAGPATTEMLKNYNITRKNFAGQEFNSSEVAYYDDRDDYVTNEPAIITNATAVFAMTLLLTYY